MGGLLPAEDSDWPDYVIGTPERVGRVIERMAAQTGATEIMLQDFIDDAERRLENYTLLARRFPG